MSKAFTKEDEDAGFSRPSSQALAIAPGPFRITAPGARIAEAHEDPRVREALTRAEVLPSIANPERAALGVVVRVRSENQPPDKAAERSYRLVSPEEAALLKSTPENPMASVESPIGRALLGASLGDVREVALPRGVETLEVIGLEGNTSSTKH